MIKDVILPEMKKLDEYIQNQYWKHLRKVPGLVGIENGRNHYKVSITIEKSSLYAM